MSVSIQEFVLEMFDGIRELGIETQSSPVIHGDAPVKDFGYCQVVPIDIEFSNFMNAAAFVHEAGQRFGDSVISHVGDSGSLVVTLHAIIKGYVTV